MKPQTTTDQELEAMEKIIRALDGLSKETVERILSWACARCHRRIIHVG